MLFVSLWLAFAAPLAHAELGSSLFEKQLSLCSSNELQRKGCAAAFRYLEEESGAQRAPASFSHQNPDARLARLKQFLASKKIPENTWVTGAFNAWLANLDRHARLVTVNDDERQASAEKILVQGAGANLRFLHGRIFVGYNMDGSAAKNRLLPGDEILSLNGKSLRPLSDSEKRRWLSQSKSPYQILVARNGQQLNLVVEEKRYYLANVEYHSTSSAKGDLEGIVRVRSFDKDRSCQEIRAAAEKLIAQGVKSLTLDLTDNPGGLVREAQCTAALFLGAGKVFARLKKFANPAADLAIPSTLANPASEPDQKGTLLTAGARLTDLPLLVKINQNTASAAEMLAASLQDARRAQIVGIRSFGKGSMQSVFHPWGKREVYLLRTTHEIYRPSGTSLQFVGVTPDLISRTLEGENYPREKELTL